MLFRSFRVGYGERDGSILFVNSLRYRILGIGSFLEFFVEFYRWGLFLVFLYGGLSRVFRE